MKGRMLLLVCD